MCRECGDLFVDHEVQIEMLTVEKLLTGTVEHQTLGSRDPEAQNFPPLMSKTYFIPIVLAQRL